MFPPERIVCLTEETVETLYLLGEEDRIVGVSGYAVRPPQVRREKPRVSAFTSAEHRRRSWRSSPISCSAFSDLQADDRGRLVRAGLAVHVFNQRDIVGILRHDPHARRAGRRAGERAELAAQLAEPARRRSGAAAPRRPRARASTSRSGTSR